MNRSSNPHAGDELPGFFDADDADAREPFEESYGDEADEEFEEFPDEELDDGEFADVTADEDEHELTEAAECETAIAPRIRRSAQHGATEQTPAGGALAITVGLVVTAAGIATAFLPSAATAIATYGFEPQGIAVIGVCMLALGCSQRRVGRMQQRFEEREQRRDEADAELRDTLAELLEHQRSGSAQPAAGEELQHALLSLQRQDQKINNLTKAIKMYGKPLMEIAGQGTEAASNLAQLKSRLDQDSEATQRAFADLAKSIRASTGNTDLGDLPQQVEKIGVALAAISQRLEDSEVRKSLVRLEDATGELRTELQALQRGDAVRAAADGLQQRLDDATRGLQEGLSQLRDGDLSGLETSVREIQREVSGLATAVAHIQAAVKGGARAAGPSASPSPAAAPAAPTPAASQPAATAAAPTGGDDAPASGYATGTRKSASKNVLGAIAKLKQMKG